MFVIYAQAQCSRDSDGTCLSGKNLTADPGIASSIHTNLNN